MEYNRTPTDVIFDHVGECYGWNDAQESLMRWLSEDDLVDWFVNGFFVRDDHDLRECLGEEDYEIVMRHYNLQYQKR